MSDPEVDRYNLRAGTQTFGPLYQFTASTKLVETAEAIGGMGSDVLKFYMGRGFAGQYGISLPSSITNLAVMAKNEPSCRHVLDLPFRHYVIWIYCFASTSDAWWKDGFSASERQKEYAEVYAFARHLLTNYTGSGKSFYLGHWEGDWYLLDNYVTTNNPSPTAIQGMRDWINTRQQAVDDAARDTPHSNVSVYVYTEANRVRDAMLNGANSNQRVINTVVPYVTNLDFVSWSSYDGQNLSQAELFSTLNYMEALLPTNKAARLPGKRVLIGEYGWGGSYSSADQEPRTRAYLQRHLQWGSRFILFWEIYNNEPDRAYWLMDNTGARTPCYFLHERFYNRARLALAEFKQTHGALPNDAQFGPLVAPMLSQPLPPPVSLALSNAGVSELNPHAATLTGTLAQGIYGEDWARVFLCWGTRDAGPLRVFWEHVTDLGTNSRFGTAVFPVTLTNLQPGARYYYRFHATNAQGEGWSAPSGEFRTSGGPGEERLVPAGAVWRYLDTGAVPPAQWTRVDYDDSAWPAGPAQLGFGDGDEATVINTNRARITTYFRRTFGVADPALWGGLLVRLLRDDGAVVHLNGSELWRDNLPSGPIGPNTQAATLVQGGDETTNFHVRAFPSNLLVAGTNALAVEVHQFGTNSSDLSFDLELLGTNPAPAVLVPTGAIWRYEDSGADLGTAWRDLAFNDAAWPGGPAPLGYGDGDEATLVASNRARITTYFRRAFPSPAPAQFQQLLLRLLRDDGAVVYLNGQEVFRSNMPTGAVDFLTYAASAVTGGDEVTDYYSIALNPARLLAGTNVLAVEVHQHGTNSSDLSFDLELLGHPPDTLPRLAAGRAAEGVLLRWPVWGSDFALHSTTNLGPPVVWQAMSGPWTVSNGDFSLRVAVEGGQRLFQLLLR
jgi:hypothetical protein